MAQNYKNHTQIVPAYHGLTGLTLLALLIGTIRYVVVAPEDNQYLAWLLLVAVLVILSLYWFTRTFALKAQDRAIRAEEQLRYFILTGKRLDPRLRLGQIIALRFASDEELPGLVQRALDENLSNKQIKQEIRHWRADHHRV